MTKSWDEHREVIIAQYKEYNKPLHEVQRFMEDQHKFKASLVLPFPLPFATAFPFSSPTSLLGRSPGHPTLCDCVERCNLGIAPNASSDH